MKPRESASVFFVCCARRNMNREGPFESIERDLESRIGKYIFKKRRRRGGGRKKNEREEPKRIEKLKIKKNRRTRGRQYRSLIVR